MAVPKISFNCFMEEIIFRAGYSLIERKHTDLYFRNSYVYFIFITFETEEIKMH